MGKKRNAVLALLALHGLAFCVTSPTLPFSSEHPPILLAIPTANVLMHGQYQLSGRFQYFNNATIGTSDSTSIDSLDSGTTAPSRNLNYSSELLFGIENRAELGIQYGKQLSFSIKALLLREDLFWPDLVFGVRNLFGTQEGGLYGVTSAKVLKTLETESYFTFAKTFPSRSRVHLGLSALNGANKELTGFNGGLEQDLGAGAYLGYEVFERFSDFHQVLSVQWRYHNLVALSVGMTEFQSWIRQDGQWGFYLTPSHSLQDGYNAPGITVSLQVLGWVPHREKRTIPERVAVLEVRNAELEKQVNDIDELKRKVEDLEARGCAPGTQMAVASDSSAMPMTGAAPVGFAPPPKPVANDTAAMTLAMLRTLSDKLGSDLADPRDIRDLMKNIIGLGPKGSEALKKAAADTSTAASAAVSLRVPAVLTMASSRDTAYVTPLRALCGDRDARVRLEALTALVKLQNHAALEDARKLLSDPDESVALAAGEAYRRLGGKADANATGATNGTAGGKIKSKSKRTPTAKGRPTQSNPTAAKNPEGGPVGAETPKPGSQP